MNRYEVVLYYQIVVYNGWSSKYPYSQIVDQRYIVETVRSDKDLEKQLEISKGDSYLKIHVAKPTELTLPVVSEEDVVKIIRSAHIGICTKDLLCNDSESIVTKQNRGDEQQKCELLFQKSVKTGGISNIISYGDTDVVILKGLIYGVMSRGKCVVPFGKYIWIDSFQYGIARVVLNKKWGAIDISGAEVLPLEYDYIKNIVDKDGKSYLECFKDGKKSIVDVRTRHLD